jgi:D-alanyl-D-alanine carboxypeptidase (penicillin-binding protein 5/6)
MYRYPGMDGIKTGFVNASGFNIASAATINGHRIIGVVMGGKSARQRDDQMAALLDKYVAPSSVMAARAPQVIRPDTSPPANQPAGVVAVTPAERPLADGPKVLSFSPAPRETMLGSPPVTGTLGDLGVQAKTGRAPDWRIQIAASGTQEGALALLQRAMPILSQTYAQASPSVEGYTDAGREYYRARFAGFASKDAATDACALLKAKSVTCVVVR